MAVDLCKVRIYDGKTAKEYTCEEIKALKEGWKKEFRKNNCVDMSRPDRAYQHYCRELDDFCNNCPHETAEWKRIEDQLPEKGRLILYGNDRFITTCKYQPETIDLRTVEVSFKPATHWKYIDLPGQKPGDTCHP